MSLQRCLILGLPIDFVLMLLSIDILVKQLSSTVYIFENRIKGNLDIVLVLLSRQTEDVSQIEFAKLVLDFLLYCCLWQSGHNTTNSCFNASKQNRI